MKLRQDASQSIETLKSKGIKDSSHGKNHAKNLEKLGSILPLYVKHSYYYLHSLNIKDK